MVVTVDENELKLVLERLDTVKLELLRLRAMLLPEEKATSEDKKSIAAAKKEVRAGKTVSLQEFVEELGC